MIADTGCILTRSGTSVNTNADQEQRSDRLSRDRAGRAADNAGATPSGVAPLCRFKMRIVALSVWIRFRPILLLLLPPPRQARWGRDRRLPTACRNRHTRQGRLYR